MLIAVWCKGQLIINSSCQMCTFQIGRTARLVYCSHSSRLKHCVFVSGKRNSPVSFWMCGERHLAEVRRVSADFSSRHEVIQPRDREQSSRLTDSRVCEGRGTVWLINDETNPVRPNALFLTQTVKLSKEVFLYLWHIVKLSGHFLNLHSQKKN